MKPLNLSKSIVLSKSAIGKITALGLGLGATGCVAVPVSDVNAPSPSNRLVAACVWPNPPTRFAYVAANRDVYEVDVLNPRLARERVSLNGGKFIAQAIYDARNPAPVTVDMVTNFTRSPFFPSGEFLASSPAYQFREAAVYALAQVYGQAAPLPPCPPSLAVNGVTQTNPNALLQKLGL